MATSSNNKLEGKVEEIVDSQLKGLSYYKQALNLVVAIPFLLLISLLFLTISAFSTKREVSLPNYIEKAKKWNEHNIAQRLSEIRLAARIMPS